MKEDKQKIKVSVSQLKDILSSEPDISDREKRDIVERALQNSEELPHWVVILLKVIAYAIGIVLAGYGSVASAQDFLIH